MGTEAASNVSRLSTFEQLRLAQEVIRCEAEALLELSNRLHTEFTAAVKLVSECKGCIIVTGMGKAGLIGQKISASLASTGTRSHFLHAADAIHGDLGRVGENDVVIILSFSGETAEVVALLSPLARLGTPRIAITGKTDSTLGRHTDVVVDIGPLKEACALGLAPSTSTTAMLAVGDALALVVSRMRGFRREDFAKLHPGGSLGRKLAKVDECMRPLEECRVAVESHTIREIFVSLGRPGRRTGAIMLVDAENRLTGIFTDSDLARLFEANQDTTFDQSMRDLMTRSPKTVEATAYLTHARAILADNKISELPVVDDQGTPVGLLDITDLVGFEFEQDESTQPAKSTTPAVTSASERQPATVPFKKTNSTQPNHESRAT